jgi:hypothetical protein
MAKVETPVRVYGGIKKIESEYGRSSPNSPRNEIEPLKLDSKMNLKAILCMRKIAAEQKVQKNLQYNKVQVRKLPKLSKDGKMEASNDLTHVF